MKLEVNNLSFSYDQRRIFSDVSFSVESGEILSLLGPNGTGKTTLFKAVLGLNKTENGDILLNGKSIREWSRTKIAQFIGYVPQHHIPPFPFKVIDVILMGRTAYLKSFASPAKTDVDIALEAMEILNISYLKDKVYTEISGGERQLVLIARALAQKPELLIMDEPTSNLDFGNQIKVLQHIKHLAQSGLAIIMSTHYPDHALQYSSKVALMKDNSISRIGVPSLIITEENMRDIYGVGVKIVNAAISNEKRVRVCVSAS